MTDSVPGPTLEIGWGETDPATAYAKLRTYTPGRPTFLLESLAPESPAGRYSVVGYRVRDGEVLSTGVDAIDSQVRSVAAAPALPSLAQAVAQSAVGYFGYGNVHTLHRIRHWEGEGPSGYFLRGAAVMLFDHHRERITIASPRPGKLAERCAWELRHAPEVSPEPTAVGAGELDGYRVEPETDALAARAIRARQFLSQPDAQLILAQGLTVPGAGADPWDVYRVLRRQLDKPLGFFLDLGQPPMGAQRWLFGASATPLTVPRPPGDERPSCDQLRDELRAGFPHPSLTGSDPVEAAQIIRRLETWPRDELGAAVGYLGPGAEASFALAESVMVFEAGTFTWSVPVRTHDDPAEVAAEARQAAEPGLAAIAAARAVAA